MPLLGIKVPHNVGHLFSQIQVPGEKTSVDDLHITLMYFEKLSIPDAIKAIDALYDITSETTPFTISVDTASHFPGHGDQPQKCAIIAKVESKELHQFRGKLAKALDKAKVEFSKNFKKYRPHITLSYAEEEPKDHKFAKIQFMVSEIILWCGEDMHDKLIVDFPLTEKYAALLGQAEQFCKLAEMSIQEARKILEVPSKYDSKEVRKKVKQLSLKHHPDQGGDVDKFRQIMEAAKVLEQENTRNKPDNTRISFSDPLLPVDIKPVVPTPRPNLGTPSNPGFPAVNIPTDPIRDWTKPVWGDWEKKYR